MLFMSDIVFYSTKCWWVWQDIFFLSKSQRANRPETSIMSTQSVKLLWDSGEAQRRGT